MSRTERSGLEFRTIGTDRYKEADLTTPLHRRFLVALTGLSPFRVRTGGTVNASRLLVTSSCFMLLSALGAPLARATAITANDSSDSLHSPGCATTGTGPSS
jgi:hypothetical protein